MYSLEWQYAVTEGEVVSWLFLFQAAGGGGGGGNLDSRNSAF